MKNSIKAVLLAALVTAVSSCNSEPQRSSVSYIQNNSFEMEEYYIGEYFQDGLLYSKYLTWDQVGYFCSACQETNTGYTGGFKLSVREGSEADTDEQAIFTSADEKAGVAGSACYLAYRKTPNMPDYDVQFDFSGFYSGSVMIGGCYITNSLYNSRLKDEEKIEKGDWLKVTIDFYLGNTLVGSLSKYLVDYTGPELKMAEEWVEWDMSQQAKDEGVNIPSFDAARFRVDMSGQNFVPGFCIDNFTYRLEVVY